MLLLIRLGGPKRKGTNVVEKCSIFNPETEAETVPYNSTSINMQTCNFQ